jgi:proteasome assembly chaperone (PAC2) family protein
MDALVFHRQLELRAPDLVAAFAGWPDAGSAATQALVYLRDHLPAERIGEIRSDSFFDFTMARPVTVIREGVIQRLRFPTFELHAWRNPKAGAEHDLVLLLGTEPNLHWHRFLEAVLALVRQLGVHRVITLGGLNDRVPHSRPARISAVVTRADMKPRLRSLGVLFSEYEGPSSIHTSLLMACLRHDVPACSLWGHVPSYAQVPWNPKVSYGLLTCLNALLELPVDLEPLRRRAQQLDELLERLVRQNPELATAIRQLEEEFDAGAEREPLSEAETLPPLSENVIRQIEELLRRQDNGRDDRGRRPEQE